MTLLAVSAPGLAARQGPPPAFEVTDEPDRWVALEVAIGRLSLTQPPRLADLGIAWASWRETMSPPGLITIPDEAWRAMRDSEQLYYRAHSSASRTDWTDHQTTLSDDELAAAPHVRLCDAWAVPTDDPVLNKRSPRLLAIAATHPEYKHINAGRGVSALICLHRFSPARPAVPESLEWVVALACESIRPGDVRFLVQRLAYDSLRLVASHYDESPGTLSPAAAGDPVDRVGTTAPLDPADPASLPTLPDEVDAKVQTWPRLVLGPFLVFRDNSPPPTDEGGTCIVLPAIGQCLFLASCKWSGAHVIHTPT